MIALLCLLVCRMCCECEFNRNVIICLAGSSCLRPQCGFQQNLICHIFSSLLTALATWLFFTSNDLASAVALPPCCRDVHRCISVLWAVSFGLICATSDLHGCSHNLQAFCEADRETLMITIFSTCLFPFNLGNLLKSHWIFLMLSRTHSQTKVTN